VSKEREERLMEREGRKDNREGCRCLSPSLAVGTSIVWAPFTIHKR